MKQAERDRPGPHPENQRKRRELRGPRHALIGVALIVAVGVVVVSGAQPVAIAISVLEAAAAVMLVIHHVWARRVALGAALVAIGWGIDGVLVLDRVTWFELGLLGVGVFEALLVAACTPRDVKVKRQRGR
jgi:hypothetical protein